jgi:LmeA-like phospholipid-binding
MAVDPEERRGRGGKVLVTFFVLIIVLAVLFVASDRIAAYAAERTIAVQAKKELAAREITTPTEPKVSVGGFPFLTQVARGRYDKITIHLDHPSSQGVTLDVLDITATGVNASTSTLVNGTGSITADDVTGVTALNWDAVNKLMNTSGFGGTGARASALPDGQVQVRVPVSLAGLSTTIVATGTLSVGTGVVHVNIRNVTTEGGDIPEVISRLIGSIKQSLSVDVKIPRLPYNLKVRDVKATPQGLTVSAVAVNVPLSSRAGS